MTSRFGALCSTAVQQPASFFVRTNNQLKASKHHGCSTVVERTPRDQEVVSSNPTGFPVFLQQWCDALNQVPQGGASLCVVKQKNGCLAVLLDAKLAQ